ncbi:hypothetical protein [Rubrivirga sp. IMCC43871]|uniref:hypothetical protein n=1 Tax=Rubrivirga sp. IMCC43871 TaxID=3391575 RepID=UPI00399012F8
MTPTAIRGAIAALVLGAVPVAAQGTFQTLDPSYGGETARRAFYGGFALSGEAAYRDADLLDSVEPGAPAPADLSLSARLDYALLPQVDLALVADLTGAAQAGRLGLSWVVVKPYWHNEGTDYAVRLAVDPVSEGGLGFRQTDVAFLSTTALSPTVTSDLSLGLRRLRTGYSDPVPGEPLAEPDAELSPVAGTFNLGSEPVRSRLVGQSVRGAWGYNVLFDPAGSRLSFGLVAEAADYTILQTRDLDTVDPDPADEESSDRVRSAVGWARAGIEFSRPSYQLAPFVSLPVFTWADVQGDPVRHGPRLQKLRVGLRITLR